MGSPVAVAPTGDGVFVPASLSSVRRHGVSENHYSPLEATGGLPDLSQVPRFQVECVSEACVFVSLY